MSLAPRGKSAGKPEQTTFVGLEEVVNNEECGQDIEQLLRTDGSRYEYDSISGSTDMA